MVPSFAIGFQLAPLSVEYCQWPSIEFEPLAVIATPARLEPVSTSLKEAPNRLATVLPETPVTTSSVTVKPAGVIDAEPLRVGASLTEVTTTLAVSVAVENAVVPPLLEVLTLSPGEPVNWSQAR